MTTSFCLLSRFHPLYINKKQQPQPLLSSHIPRHRFKSKALCSVPQFPCSSVSSSPLRVSIEKRNEFMKKGRGPSTVCCAGARFVTTCNLQWISTICSVILVLARGTAINKGLLIPLFALQAPSTVISWIKSEYGTWTAFVALLIRLFFGLPGELELPLSALLLVNVAPYRVINFGGTQQGAIVALVIAGYLAFQHFSRAGNMQRAFEQGSIVATLAVICSVVVSLLFLI